MNNVTLHLLFQIGSAIAAGLVSYFCGFTWELFFIVFFGMLIYLTPPDKPKD